MAWRDVGRAGAPFRLLEDHTLKVGMWRAGASSTPSGHTIMSVAVAVSAGRAGAPFPPLGQHAEGVGCGDRARTAHPPGHTN